MNQFRLAIFADKQVGYEAVKFLKESYPNHLKAVFVVEHSDIYDRIVELGITPVPVGAELSTKIKLLELRDLDYILLAWWPYIIKKSIISIPRKGVLNFHPSYLPYNQGKHYNFWTLVERTPFGVSIAFVDEGIDSGDIAFQKRIEKVWEDTGETLFFKAQRTMVELFMESYPSLVAGDFERKTQDTHEGSFHYAKELDPASEIKLDKTYIARDLLNLIRARVFPPNPTCWFVYDENKYGVVVDICKKSKDKFFLDDFEIEIDSEYNAVDLLPDFAQNEELIRRLCFFDNGELYRAEIKVIRS